MPTEQAKRKQRKKQKRKQKQQQKQKQADDQQRQSMPDDKDHDGGTLLFPVFPTMTTWLPSTWTNIRASYIIKDAFRLHTLLAIGAAVQVALCMGLPQPWCYVPALALLGFSVATTTFQIIGPLLPMVSFKNAFIDGAVMGRTTAFLERSPYVYDRGVVVFHFGARFNHPLGLLAPGGRDMTMLFQATIKALEDDRASGGTDFGLLGANLFRGGERASNDTIFLVMYFRDIDGLQRFARSPVHERAHRWLDRHRKRYPHLSAFHETFDVPAGSYESLYINTAPILLGNTIVKEESGDFENEDGPSDDSVWSTSLMNVGDTQLRDMKTRMRFQTELRFPLTTDGDGNESGGG